MHKIRDTPKILVKISDENISDITENLGKFYIEYDYIQEITGFSKKRLDLWLFRHKSEISTFKENKVKFISLNILKFIPKILKSWKNKE